MIRDPTGDDNLKLRHTPSHTYVMTIMAPLSPPLETKFDPAESLEVDPLLICLGAELP